MLDPSPLDDSADMSLAAVSLAFPERFWWLRSSSSLSSDAQRGSLRSARKYDLARDLPCSTLPASPPVPFDSAASRASARPALPAGGPRSHAPRHRGFGPCARLRQCV